MHTQSTRQHSVYLVDRQTLFIESFTKLLDGEPGFHVVGASVDSDHALNAIGEREPDIVFSDVELPGRGAMTLASEVRKRYPAMRFVFLASYLSHICLDEALRIQAHGYLLKTDPLDEFIELIRRVATGEESYSNDVRREMSIDNATKKYRVDSMHELSALTPRQLEVLRQLSRGRSVKEVAHSMSLSERAVESHKYRIMRKLHIHDRVDLAMFAIRQGLLVP